MPDEFESDLMAMMLDPGSEAITEPAETSNQQVINYYFPVEIVVVGNLPEEEREAIEAQIWEKLNDALDRMV
jgi:hypothetical protein